VTPVEFRGDLLRQKTRIPGLSRGVVCVIIRLDFLVEHRLVTDRQTDRRTDTGPWLVPRMHSIARYKFEGGLNLLHGADDDAVIGLWLESTATAALAK